MLSVLKLCFITNINKYILAKCLNKEFINVSKIKYYSYSQNSLIFLFCKHKNNKIYWFSFYYLCSFTPRRREVVQHRYWGKISFNSNSVVFGSFYLFAHSSLTRSNQNQQNINKYNFQIKLCKYYSDYLPVQYRKLKSH